MFGFSIFGAKNPLRAGAISARGWTSGLPMVKCCNECGCGQALAVESVDGACASHGFVGRVGPVKGSCPMAAALSEGLVPNAGTVWDGAGAGGAAPTRENRI